MVRTLAVAGGLAALVLGAGSSVPAAAEPAADNNYRQSVMTTNGGLAIGRIVGDLFPAGSGQGNTAALPAIWEMPDDFTKATQAFTDASAKLAAAARGGNIDAFKAAFGGANKSCVGCHTPFRKKSK